jgi:hypothetical protein
MSMWSRLLLLPAILVLIVSYVLVSLISEVVALFDRKGRVS